VRLSATDIDHLLAEDTYFGDLTVRALAIGDKPGRMIFTARCDLVLCGSDEVTRLLSRLGGTVIFAAQTGTYVEKGSLLFEVEGTAAALHAGWKTAQTLMEWASGVATLTREIVTAARLVAPRIAIVCTRKAVPFTRQLSLKAVIAGGAECHRLGLFDTIMLFDEHRTFFTKPNDLNAIITRLKEYAPERAIMVEVTSEADAFGAAEAMADVIQLEKFAPDMVARVVHGIKKRLDGRPVIAAAGGINAQNACEYAKAGADTLVTSAPFYAKPVDIQVRINPQ
jgi:molybdenum transport protein